MSLLPYPGTDITFATSVRQEMRRVCVPMGGRSKSEGRMKVFFSTFAILCPAPRGQNMAEFRPENTSSQQRCKDSAWRVCRQDKTQLAAVQTHVSTVRHTLSFCLSPTKECRLVKCPLNILYIHQKQWHKQK